MTGIFLHRPYRGQWIPKNPRGCNPFEGWKTSCSS